MLILYLLLRPLSTGNFPYSICKKSFVVILIGFSPPVFFNVYLRIAILPPARSCPIFQRRFQIVSHQGWLVLLSRLLPVDSASPLFACALFRERHHSITIQNTAANSWSLFTNHTILRKKHTCISVQMCFCFSDSSLIFLSFYCPAA